MWFSWMSAHLPRHVCSLRTKLERCMTKRQHCGEMKLYYSFRDNRPYYSWFIYRRTLSHSEIWKDGTIAVFTVDETSRFRGQFRKWFQKNGVCTFCTRNCQAFPKRRPRSEIWMECPTTTPTQMRRGLWWVLGVPISFANFANSRTLHWAECSKENW